MTAKPRLLLVEDTPSILQLYHEVLARLDVVLIDAETGAPQDVTLDGGLRDLYRKRIAAWREEIESYCLKRQMHYVPVTTDLGWDELVLYQLRRRGLVK